MLLAIYNKLAVSKWGAFSVIVMAIAVKLVLVSIVTAINAQPLDAMPFANTIFLLFQRPIFVIFGALSFAPILLRNPLTIPITALLEHAFWFPLARLSYGAYLSACVFMLFRTYNMERGLWACEIDAFFLFMAYLSFAFLFSFLITFVVEQPCHNLFEAFVIGSREVYLRSPAPSKGKRASSKKDGVRSSEESESDAETLDHVDDSDEISHYLSKKQTIVQQPTQALAKDSSSVKVSSVDSTALTKPKPPKVRETGSTKVKKDAQSSGVKAPLLQSTTRKPTEHATASVEAGKQKKPETKIKVEVNESSPVAGEEDGLYFLE